jgi:hypothetical protein
MGNMPFFVDTIKLIMKNILKIVLVSFITSSFFSSCTAKKQNCDAYGSISKIEKSLELNNTKTTNSILSEKKG